MGKINDDRNTLEHILNEMPKKSKISIDESEPVEKIVLPKKKPKAVNSKEFCGMTVPLPIYNICQNIIACLKEQGKYTPAMDFMIYNCSVQQFLYNDLITQKINQTSTIPTRSLTTASESYRRALQACGLTVVDKKAGLNPENDVDNNPLKKFLDSMNDENIETQTVKKKKCKKQE